MNSAGREVKKYEKENSNYYSLTIYNITSQKFGQLQSLANTIFYMLNLALH